MPHHRNLHIQWWGTKSKCIILSAPVYESRQSDYVTAETGSVGKHTVEPPYVWIQKLYGIADIEHCENSTWADYAPVPCAEKHKTARNGKSHQRDVNDNFHLRERLARHSAESHGKTFAGHRHRTAFDLEGNACGHNGATGKLSDDLRHQRLAHKSGSDNHVHVDKPAEYEANQQLKQLQGIEFAAQNKYLEKYQNEVHHYGVAADGERRHKPRGSGK